MPSGPVPPRRVRRVPERGVLHQVPRKQLATLLALAGDRLPRFVVGELQRHLACGILAFGFARVRCWACKNDELVASSCKGQGFGPFPEDQAQELPGLAEAADRFEALFKRLNESIAPTDSPNTVASEQAG